jgi:hypothetical protein
MGIIDFLNLCDALLVAKVSCFVRAKKRIVPVENGKTENKLIFYESVLFKFNFNDIFILLLPLVHKTIL